MQTKSGKSAKISETECKRNGLFDVCIKTVNKKLINFHCVNFRATSLAVRLLDLFLWHYIYIHPFVRSKAGKRQE